MILAFDTSTRELTAAVVDTDRVVCEHSEQVDRNHSVSLLPVIQRLLEQADISVSELDGIATGQGPGSYTGVRIAVTTAKTLAWSVGIPLVGISTLETLAAGWASGSGSGKQWIVPLIDARRGNAYTALFESDGAEVRRLAPDKLRPVHDWSHELARRCADKPEVSLVFVGDTGPFDRVWGALEGDEFADRLARGKWRVEPARVEARHTARLAGQKLKQQAGHGGEADMSSVHAFVPDYTQATEVEIKFANKES